VALGTALDSAPPRDVLEETHARFPPRKIRSLGGAIWIRYLRESIAAPKSKCEKRERNQPAGARLAPASPESTGLDKFLNYNQPFAVATTSKALLWPKIRRVGRIA